jgi:hypothetical protein
MNGWTILFGVVIAISAILIFIYLVSEYERIFFAKKARRIAFVKVVAFLLLFIPLLLGFEYTAVRLFPVNRVASIIFSVGGIVATRFVVGKVSWLIDRLFGL